MASSRVEKIGTVFSRITGMIRAGAIKWEERPLWYDVYSAFPPKYEPRYDREVAKDIPVRKLIYPEDELRAQFYKSYGSPGFINMTDESTHSMCEKFITKYVELAKQEPNKEADTLFFDTEQALSNQGIALRKKQTTTTTSPISSDSIDTSTTPSQTAKA